MLGDNFDLISQQPELTSLIEHLDAAPALALDIETINWWDPKTERVALLQLAFRASAKPRVAVIDAFAELDLEPLRQPLELSSITKAIHNAVYDAVRISRHFYIHTSPIHDTMLAARRSGEPRCSLQAQAQLHLGRRLDKGERLSDWSRRPLRQEQLRYAAQDALCTLLLYENQVARGLSGRYRLRDRPQSRQTSLPLSDDSYVTDEYADTPASVDVEASLPEGLHSSALALLGIVTELDGHYSPERLVASVGSERVGLAGWIIDQVLGAETDLDEDTVKLEIARLCEGGLVNLTEMRRLEATGLGARLWQQLKPR